jgi:hypothetical protein
LTKLVEGRPRSEDVSSLGPSASVPGDCALQVCLDHGAEFLAPDLKHAWVKELGRSAIGSGYIDPGARTAGEESDDEF